MESVEEVTREEEEKKEVKGSVTSHMQGAWLCMQQPPRHMDTVLLNLQCAQIHLRALQIPPYTLNADGRFPAALGGPAKC